MPCVSSALANTTLQGGGGGSSASGSGSAWERGVDWLEDHTARHVIPVRPAMGYGSDSAAAEQSDGYKLGSAFFVMAPFRYNVFRGFR